MRLTIAFFVLLSHCPFCAGQEDRENPVAVSRGKKHASHKSKLQITAEGKITRDEFQASLDRTFDKLDRNSDRQLNSLEDSMPALIPPADTNMDGVLSADEYRKYHSRRFDHLNIPTGTAMVGNLVAPLPTESEEQVLNPKNGGANLQMSPELWEQNGIIVLALNYEVTEVTKAFNQPVLDFSKKISIPPTEVLDLSCAKDWEPYKEQGLVGAGNQFFVNTKEQWGRTEYILRVDDKVIGLVGVIGSNSIMNPRYLGEAKAFLGLDDGRLFVNILPPIEGSGGTSFRVIIAPIEESQKKTFRLLIGSADPPERRATN
ncbi:MAG: hypothetical protein GY768_26485 [Planctomycetaceae bacterium]|nr:hypothetical protein [Planctomycetaceae bacterium]